MAKKSPAGREEPRHVLDYRKARPSRPASRPKQWPDGGSGAWRGWSLAPQKTAARLQAGTAASVFLPGEDGQVGELNPLHHHDAEARSSDCAGLAGHRATEALTLERGGQIGMTGCEQARKELHDTSPCDRVTRDALALRHGAGRLVDAYIGSIAFDLGV